MSNSFYTRVYAYAQRTLARGERVKADLDAIVTGFDGIEAEIPRPNLLINGGFRIAQRGTAFRAAVTHYTNDDSDITLDRWVLLSDGDDRVDVTQETSTVPNGAYAAILLDVETVSNPSEKFGIVQILEKRDAALCAGKSVTLSFKAKTVSGQVENLRAAILSWDGTADSPTVDVVSSWGAEGSNPTWASNWTAENTPSNLALTDSYATYTVGDVDVDTSGMVNLAVFIWVDDTDLVAGDAIYIADVKLELGSYDSPFVQPQHADEVYRCMRWARYWGGAGYGNLLGSMFIKNATEAWCPVVLPIPLRTGAPTLAQSSDLVVRKLDFGTEAREGITSSVVTLDTTGGPASGNLTSGALLKIVGAAGSYTEEASYGYNNYLSVDGGSLGLSAEF